ncbi:hypothetical protein [Candidatus Nanohalovita haloferacivicina]|uniref:COG1470 family protein n=1 Tax=Candidatus Nanohalovita haloferacivicina TaxID=2978046 RepID=UPI00325FAE09|nr:hypothetical protein HBNXNv_0198 [Candidatus Nanohalobia archaeon BNXNv]
MSPEKRFTKIILAGLLTLAFVSATAAEISTAGDQEIVWKNSNIQPQLTATCSLSNATSSEIEVGTSGDNVFTESSGQIDVESSELQGVWSSTKYVNYTCSNANDTVSEARNLSFVSFSLVSKSNERSDYSDFNGISFVGQLMKDEKGSLGNRRGIFLSFNDISQIGEDEQLEGLKQSSYSFGTNGKLVNSDQEPKVDSNNQYVKVFPRVRSYIESDQSFKVRFDGSGVFSGLEKRVPVDSFTPFVHAWSSSVERDPGRRMGFDQVRQGAYVYELFMDYEPSDNFPETEIDDDNFVLDVEKKQSDWDSGYETVKSDLEVLTTSEPESGSANYKVEIPQVADTELEGLENDDDPYKFVLKYRYVEDGSTYSFKVDEMLVDKTDNPSRFSGQILNSAGNGVQTDMTLSPSNNDNRYVISSGSNGQFSKDLSTDLSTSFDIGMEFSDSGSRVSSVDLSGVRLEDANLGSQDISAINFDYWQNPQDVAGLDISGLKPVNMMAVRFGYDIGSVDSISMDFDSSEVAPKNLKVYECDAWNFWGTRCESNWDKVADNSNSSVISYPEVWANIDNANLYGTSGGEEILRNAYVIGKSAKITLQNSISVESSSVKYNGEFQASGVLVSDTGDRVSDADVTVSLVKEGETVESWSTNSDSTGSFEISETVDDADAGNYQLKIEASKSPYQSFEMMSEKTIEVYYETGIRLEAPTSKEVVQGNKTEIDITVSNTGQQPVENVDLSVSGVKSIYYSFDSNVNSLDSGESRSLGLTLDLPADYCNLPCGSPPQLDISVSGSSNEQDVSDSILTSIVLVEGDTENTDSSETEDQDTSTSDSQSSTEDESSPESSTSPISNMQDMTGDFVQKQGELNIALGLIFIFTMMLALSVKKKKGSGDDRRRGGSGRGGGRPPVQRPPINSSQQDQEENEGDELEESEEDSEDEGEAEEDESTAEDSDEEEEGFECSVCGESFESESGRDLHEQAVH